MPAMARAAAVAAIQPRMEMEPTAPSVAGNR